MPNLEDIKIGDPAVTLEEIPGNEAVSEVVEQPASGMDFSAIKQILLAPTGEGDIANYIEHPLNFDKSEGLAQVLRGVTGMVGNVALAIVDIGIGLVRWKRGRVVAGG